MKKYFPLYVYVYVYQPDSSNLSNFYNKGFSLNRKGKSMPEYPIPPKTVDSLQIWNNRGELETFETYKKRGAASLLYFLLTSAIILY